jgi:hypothetical protein
VKYRHKVKHLIAVVALILAATTAALATPTLQLNIGGGVYDLGTQTIVGSSNNFTLFAYLIEDAAHDDLVSGTYFISMAISPQVSSSATNVGSFVFEGITRSVQGGMVYGNPPLEMLNGTLGTPDVHDLQNHGVFPTYYAQQAFTFNPSVYTQDFNAQDFPGLDPTTVNYTSGKKMYYHAFTVDVSNMDPAYMVHFDLYNTVATPVANPSAYDPGIPQSCSNGSTKFPSCKKGKTFGTYDPGIPPSCSNGSTSFPDCSTVSVMSDIDIKSFAPFSHDAAGGPHEEIPEPQTILLLGSGLLGLALARRRMGRSNG